MMLLILKKHPCFFFSASDANPANIEAVSTNTTDYNLSKEESGRQLIIQDESKNSSSLDELDLEKLSAFW